MLSAVFLRISGLLILAAALVVALQDFLILPGLSVGTLLRSGNSASDLPAGVEQLWLHTADGAEIDIRRMKVSAKDASKKHVAILFHGNASSVDGMFGYQVWFQNLGITSYVMGYRGFGESSGWPSEAKFYRDAEELWNLVQQEESIPAEDVILMGQSIGSGTATELALRISPGLLVLQSPFTSLPDVVRQMGFYRYLVPFLWYEFNNAEKFTRLGHTDVVLTHGKQDRVIPYSHSERLLKRYAGSGSKQLLSDERAGHNDIMSRIEVPLAELLRGWAVSRDSPQQTGAR